ncbi:MAG: nitroreductase family protein [Oscillospiraceae bacterium]|nr:nitroreductase family protein [Oscillospiraceae bacterium]
MVIINQERCIGCARCKDDCLAKAICLAGGKAEIIKDCFHCGHCVAVCPTEAVRIEGEGYDMHDVEPTGDGFGITPEAMLHAIKTRRSVRQFKRECPSMEELHMLLEAGRFSPTASNAQNVSYLVFTRETEILRDLAMREMRSLQGDEAAFYRVFPPPMSLSRVSFEDDDFLFKGAPAVILTLSPHAVNAAIASCNMEMQAAAMGLGVLYVGFFTRLAENCPALRDYLALRQEDHVVTCLAVGYPDVRYLRTPPRKKAKAQWR